MKKLVIVESPTKAKTISRFLGKDYTIKYSMGHVMDLPKSKLGIALENNFAPQYEVIEDKKKLIAELQSAAKEASTIILATDPDREGEAIAQHVRDMLPISHKEIQRIVFHEITKDAIEEALKQPRTVDGNLVNAQTARRVLDRLVGYQISPVLWRKVRRGLSAGRVQSVALRLIVEREREIETFSKKLFWTVQALLLKNNDQVEFELIEINNERIEVKESFVLYDGEYTVTKTFIDSQVKADAIVTDLQRRSFYVADVAKKQTRRSPYPPFTTSTLQQEASRRYGLSGRRTMSLAQKLYEEGYITYHRTDSVNVAQTAITQIRSYVERLYGRDYLSEKPRIYTTKQKLAQEAHEAIRPTKVEVQMSEIRDQIGPEYAKIYELIWRRAIASQMADALLESTSVLVDTKSNDDQQLGQSQEEKMYRLKANGSVLLFDGFLKLNPQALQDTKLPVYEVGEKLSAKTILPDMHETLPPPRYNDASLIGALEEKGIGRPSTYASIISTLVDRSYVERVERRFEPTAIGKAVNDFLVANFSTIDDVPFTAEMEDKLDEVATGQKEWVSMMREFYQPFEKQLFDVENAARVKIEVEETNEQCPQCMQGNLVIRTGRFGKFFACSRFPECKFTKPYAETTKFICPKDGGTVIVKKTRKGRKFYGCSNYPKCDFAAWKLEDIKKASDGKNKALSP